MTDQATLDYLDSLLEQNKTDQIEETAKTTPFTGEESYMDGGYYDSEETFFNVDRMETPITEEESDNPIVIQVVESDAYKNSSTSGERNAMIREALDSTNRSIYESKGEPTRFDNVRLQKFENQDGAPRTFIVPKPGAESTGFQRGIGGAILNTAKMVGEGVEKGFGIPFTDKRTPGTDDFLTDPDTDYVAENFPTYPSAGAMESVGQEVIPIIIGALVGAKGVDKLDKAPGAIKNVHKKINDALEKRKDKDFIPGEKSTATISKKLADWISSRWDEAKKVDPANAKANLERALKGLFIERGANLGATMATPENMEPLIGDDILEYVGIDAEENRDLGHYIDNEAFTALGSVGIKLIGAGYGFAKGLFPKFSKKPKTRAAEVGMLLLKEIDPGIKDSDPGFFVADRARMLGEVIQNNKEFRLGILGQRTVKNADGTESIVDVLPGGSIQLDSGTALALGAREYVERAYGWMKATMEPEVYEQTINKYAQTVIDNIVGLKQGRKGNQIVQAGEASINSDASRVLTAAADDAVEGGVAQANQAGVLLGDDIVAPVSDALGAVQKTRTGVELAENVANATQDKDVIVSMLNKSRETNALGNTSTEMQTFQQLTGEDLYKGWQSSYKNYNDAFEALPNDIPVDMEDLKNLIEDVSTKTNDFDFVTTATTKQDPFREMLQGLKRRVTGVDDAGKPIVETGEEVLSRLDNIDLKWLYTNLRPEISRRLNALEAAGAPTSKPLLQLKEWIDGAADASGQTEFRAAMDLYEEHAGTYLRTDELAQWESKARKVRDKEVAPGVNMGQENVYEEGMQTLANAEQALTTGKLDAVLNALTKAKGSDITPEMAQAYVGLAIRSLTKTTQSGGKVTSAQIKESIQPYLKQLEGTNPEAIKMFDDTVANLEMVELGLTTAKEANAVAEAAYQKIMVEAQERAASKFVNNLTGSNPSTMTDPSEVFRTIFNSKNAPDQIADLFRQADEIGNPLIKDGIKSKYISYVKDRIFTNKRMASEVTEDSVGATNEVSPAQLKTILGQEFDNTLSTLKVVFKDEPQKAESVTHLLDLLDVAVNNRAIRGNNFGSTTVLDEKLKEKMNRLIVLTLGVLNPVATKARNISAALAETRTKEIAEAIELQIDMMITSPQYFSEVMEAVAKKSGGAPLLKLLERNMIRGGITLDKQREIDQLEAVPPEFEETQ